MKPELMAEIRRQALAQPDKAADPQQTSPRQTASPLTDARTLGAAEQDAAKNREALSLAAAAAESKGVELKEKALEAYAETIDPEWDRRHDGGEEKRGRKNKSQDDKEEGENKKTNLLTAAGIKETALENAENDPLLSILNRLPGKDGRRWVVLPFEFSDNGRDFKVSMRILLEPSNNANYMALDIMETGKADGRQLFILETTSDSPLPASCSLSVYLQHEIPPKAQSRLVGELSKVLEIKPEHVFIKINPASFAFEAERGEELPRSIDEVA
jgi:hypothetical protein